MRETFVLLAEHAISRLRGTAGWEEIAAGAGIELPVQTGCDYPPTVMVDVADQLAAALSTDRPTALRAIGEHGFPFVLATVPGIFETDMDLPPPQHADHIFRQFTPIVDGLLGGIPPEEIPPMTWTREGRRREFTARADENLADLMHGQIIALLDWLDLDARMERQDLGNGLVRFELWYG